MKIPADYLNQVVAVQLGRPVCVYDYAAHIHLVNDDGSKGEQQFMLKEVVEPAVEPVEAQRLHALQQPIPMRTAARDSITFAQVLAITEDSLTLRLFMPSEDNQGVRFIKKTIPSALVLSIDMVEQYEAPVPELVKMQRAPAPSKPLVTL